MSDTPHIKRFEEYRTGYREFSLEDVIGRVAPMLNDLAEHVERLELQFAEFAAVSIDEEVPKLIAEVRSADTSITITDTTPTP